MKFTFAAALLTAATSAQITTHKAVLVAGSNTYSNYRHQADIAHAYQILIADGIAPENIITMMYDDVAWDKKNPFPGQLFNQPDGEDVYAGIKIDYKGKDVTPEKFIAVMTGDAETAGGKVLTSDKNTKLFVNFSDHGAPGLIAFPGSSGYLYADQLQDTINIMEEKGLFGEMVFYLEACESGSMFPLLTEDQNVYAVTASNATLSSFAIYCGADAKVNGIKIGSCLGDEFSVNWMEDSDVANPLTESLDDQFKIVQTKTVGSPVQKFGDFDFVSEPIGNFEGNYSNQASFIEYSLEVQKNLQVSRFFRESAIKEKGLVDSRDVMMNYLYDRVESVGDTESYQELMDELYHRMSEDSVFLSVFPHHRNIDLVAQPTEFDCLRYMIAVHDENCGRFSDYSLKYVKHLVHTCETETETMIQQYAELLASTCLSVIA